MIKIHSIVISDSELESIHKFSSTQICVNNYDKEIHAGDYVYCMHSKGSIICLVKEVQGTILQVNNIEPTTLRPADKLIDYAKELIYEKAKDFDCPVYEGDKEVDLYIKVSEVLEILDDLRYFDCK